MGLHEELQTFCFVLLAAFWFAGAKLIFDNVYLTTQNVIDEEFHLRMGYAYCVGEYSRWDPKITTLPGLYVISALFLSPLSLCTVYWLRFVSLSASFVNLILYYLILKFHNGDSQWKNNIVSAFNLSIVPPIFFFSHLYYTDTVSITMFLLLYYSYLTERHLMASVCGLLSVIVRQTNIIYVGMFFGLFLLKEISKKFPKTYLIMNNYEATVRDVKKFIERFVKSFRLTLANANFDFWLNSSCYLTAILAFMLFVFWNGSIVVGDKSAHQASFNLPQIFYFSLFCLIFAWSYFLKEARSFFNHLLHYKSLFLIILVVCLLIVHYNTQIHQYLLADNRHYVFYVWKRLFEKYFYFRYLIVPVYLFSLYVIIYTLSCRINFIPTLLCLLCIMTVLVPQKLLEVRYFFIPFLYFRLNMKQTGGIILLFEFLTSLVINIVTLHLFFTKTIHWENFEEPQHLIW